MIKNEADTLLKDLRSKFSDEEIHEILKLASKSLELDNVDFSPILFALNLENSWNSPLGNIILDEGPMLINPHSDGVEVVSTTIDRAGDIVTTDSVKISKHSKSRRINAKHRIRKRKKK